MIPTKASSAHTRRTGLCRTTRAVSSFSFSSAASCEGTAVDAADPANTFAELKEAEACVVLDGPDTAARCGGAREVERSGTRTDVNVFGKR